MKDKLAYSPREFKLGGKTSPQLTKSPPKTNILDSAHFTQDIGFRYSQPQSNQLKEFQNLKKVSQETSILRQTMNSKLSDRLFPKGTFDDQDEKPNKLNDFLRQTMGPKSTKSFSQKLISDTSINQKEIYIKPEFNGQSFRSYQRYPVVESSKMISQSKSGTNLLQHSRNYNDYQKLNQKIDRNKKIIQELKKTASYRTEHTNFLKNVNQTKSPTYINLDHEKQSQDYVFRKKKKQSNSEYMTPQVDKKTYEARFQSSPFVEVTKSNDKRFENASIPSPTVTTIKKKNIVQSQTKCMNLFDQFEQGKKLGEGKFGCVNLVRHKISGGIFALKKIPKTLIKSHMMVQQLALEIRLQICLHHQNILGMYGFFDDKTHLYIVLQYMDGGTLYQMLKKGKLNESQTAIVIKQMTAAIEYMHDLGIAHRDIKPENIVISNNVYKLCDFGWAAMCNQRRKTYCGTFDYVAPQILQGVQYDMTVDLWCLGVMTYELMTGKAPFYHISRKQTMKKILNVENQNIIYPETMSQKAKDFIDRLVRKNPLERLKANQALHHPFLQNVNLEG